MVDPKDAPKVRVVNGEIQSYYFAVMPDGSEKGFYSGKVCKFATIYENALGWHILSRHENEWQANDAARRYGDSNIWDKGPLLVVKVEVKR
jgi:hypothetical protein